MLDAHRFHNNVDNIYSKLSFRCTERGRLSSITPSFHSVVVITRPSHLLVELRAMSRADEVLSSKLSESFLLRSFWCTTMLFWIDIELCRKIRVQSILAFLVCESLILRTEAPLTASSALPPRCETRPGRLLAEYTTRKHVQYESSRIATMIPLRERPIAYGHDGLQHL